MKLTVNGKDAEFEESLTLAELLQRMNIAAPTVALELNLKIIKRGDYDKVKISDGDHVEILQMIGGG